MMSDSSSDSISLQLIDGTEFTLEDTLGTLMDLKLERDQELERLYDVQINNGQFTPLDKSSDILEKQQQLTASFIQELNDDKADECLIPDTIDTYTSTVTQLAKEVKNMEKLVELATNNLHKQETEISRLKEKKAGLSKMKEACSAANKTIAGKTYADELRTTNKIFKEVRAETQEVVAKLFPADDKMRDFLAIICSAYFSGGDDVWVDVEPEFRDAANFLLEADVIAYNTYDKSRVRLVDL